MTTPQAQKIVLERTYRATVEELWALWTTKEGFESWWGPQGFRVEVQELEAKKGGLLRYEMIAASPEMVEAMKAMGQPSSHAVRSTFTEVSLHQRVALTNLLDFIPGVAPYESTIVAEFAAVEGGVRVTVTLDPLHDEAWTGQQVAGMTSQIGKLDERFGLS